MVVMVRDHDQKKIESRTIQNYSTHFPASKKGHDGHAAAAAIFVGVISALLVHHHYDLKGGNFLRTIINFTRVFFGFPADESKTSCRLSQ